MGMTYSDLAPIPGKWYVSERYAASSNGTQLVGTAPTQPRLPTAEMIVGGPFDTYKLAQDWNNLTQAAGYIWEKPSIGE
ncbi:MAG: hypothetical protein ACI9HK_004891 [Pirellulaceae bacterium]|jgi:hypothetical protein